MESGANIATMLKQEGGLNRHSSGDSNRVECHSFRFLCCSSSALLGIQLRVEGRHACIFGETADQQTVNVVPKLSEETGEHPQFSLATDLLPAS